MSWKAVGDAVLPGVLPAVASVFGSKKQGSSNDKALAAQMAADAEAKKILQDNEMRRRQEYDALIAAEKAQWEAEEARRAPYRQASLGILGGAADRLGYDLSGLSAAPSSAATSKAGATKSKVPSYVQDSIGGISGLQPTTPPIEVPEPEKMTLADLGRMRSAGDWRTGRRVM